MASRMCHHHGPHWGGQAQIGGQPRAGGGSAHRGFHSGITLSCDGRKGVFGLFADEAYLLWHCLSSRFLVFLEKYICHERCKYLSLGAAGTCGVFDSEESGRSTKILQVCSSSHVSFHCWWVILRSHMPLSFELASLPVAKIMLICVPLLVDFWPMQSHFLRKKTWGTYREFDQCFSKATPQRRGLTSDDHNPEPKHIHKSTCKLKYSIPEVNTSLSSFAEAPIKTHLLLHSLPWTDCCYTTYHDWLPAPLRTRHFHGQGVGAGIPVHNSN